MVMMMMMKEKTAEKHLYEKLEKRDVMTDSNPKGKYGEDVNVRNVDNRVDENNAEKPSSQSRRPSMGEPVTKSFGDAAFGNILDKDPGKDKGHEKPEMRAVMVDIIDAVMLNTEYEAGIKVNQGRERNMSEKPETRDVMDDITDAVMLNKEYKAGVKVHRGREFSMHEKPETRDGMFKANPKGNSNENLNMNNVMDKNNAAAPIEDPNLKKQLYEKPEERDVMDDIIAAVMLNMEYEAGFKIKTNPKGKSNENVTVDNVMNVDTAAASIEDLKMCYDNYYQYSIMV
jgi:hypothetical protein